MGGVVRLLYRCGMWPGSHMIVNSTGLLLYHGVRHVVINAVFSVASC